MQIITDYEGRKIRLTDERIENHIALIHPEILAVENCIAETLSNPWQVRQSTMQENVRLYYRWYIGTVVGDKWACVTVAIDGDDAFMLTAYMTDRIRKGDLIWQSES